MSDYHSKEVQDVLDAGPFPGDDFFRLQVRGNTISKHINVTPQHMRLIAQVVRADDDRPTSFQRMLVENAYNLLGDGDGGDWDVNAEYTRGIANLLGDSLGGFDDYRDVLDYIRTHKEN